MTDVDENEDPEVLAERDWQARSARFHLPYAEVAGHVSLWCTISGFILAVLCGGNPTLRPVSIIPLFLLFMGQVATALDYGMLVLLKVTGTRHSLWWPAVLGIPGATISGLISFSLVAAGVAA